MNDRKRMEEGRLFSPYNIEDNPWNEIRAACKKFNDSQFWTDRSALEELMKLFGHAERDMILTPPFFCDHGNLIFFGKNFFANTNLTILDSNYVRFGDNVMIGPNVGIYTSEHPIDAGVRSKFLEYALPVTIGSGVWIGGNVVINGGVTIGDDVVIGSGSVVVKDIPSHCIAVGNPCRVLRYITEEEREYWRSQEREYYREEREHSY